MAAVALSAYDLLPSHHGRSGLFNSINNALRLSLRTFTTISNFISYAPVEARYDFG
jgi:hypothetical protein